MNRPYRVPNGMTSTTGTVMPGLIQHLLETGTFVNRHAAFVNSRS